MTATLIASFGSALMGIGIVLSSDEGNATMAKVGLILPLLVGAGFLAATKWLFEEYSKQRPSDIVIDDAGLSIEQGALKGKRIAWSSFDRERCLIEIDPTRYVQKKVNGQIVSREECALLVVGTHEGEKIVLAESLDREEKVSLSELRESILGAYDARGAATPPAPSIAGSSILQCSSCGAPVPPDDAGEVRCQRCGSPVPIPNEVREKIRVASRLVDDKAKLETAVRKLLEQPSARRPAAVLSILTFVLFAAPVASIALFFLQGRNGSAAWLATKIVLISIPVIFALNFFVRLFIGDRQALRALTLGMSARNSVVPGDPPTCRQCAGSLGVRPDHILAICLFCRTENLLGLDLRPAAAETQQRVYALEPVITKRRDGRRRSKTGLAVSAVITVALVMILV